MCNNKNMNDKKEDKIVSPYNKPEEVTRSKEVIAFDLFMGKMQIEGAKQPDPDKFIMESLYAYIAEVSLNDVTKERQTALTGLIDKQRKEGVYNYDPHNYGVLVGLMTAHKAIFGTDYGTIPAVPLEWDCFLKNKGDILYEDNK